VQESVQRRTRTSTVVTTWLRAMISSGQMQVGDRLPSEWSLCRRLGVGRSSVREAFRALETLGYVEIRPGRGRFLQNGATYSLQSHLIEHLDHTQPKRSDVVNLCVAIESMAASLAATRHTIKEIEQMVCFEDDFEHCIRRYDVNGVVLADESFHGAVLVAGHNDVLISIGKQIHQYLREVRLATFGLPGYAQRSVAPHRAIIAAIQSHNANAARDAIASHIYSTHAEATEVAMALDDRMLIRGA
jgi:GntR family transcriptional repressor for pyruvate dehydrogenase complex